MPDDRAYTVAELDQLRRVLTQRWLWGTSNVEKQTGWSRGHTDTQLTEGVEALVRTHMIAGHTAQDIIEADR